MEARNRVGIGLSYRAARLDNLAELVLWNRFLGSLKFKNSGSVCSDLNALDPHDEPADVADDLGKDGKGEHHTPIVTLLPLQAHHHNVHGETHCNKNTTSF
jgi:hypothetical protein